MISVTAPQWVGILIGFWIGFAASMWGMSNPESIIRLARWKDRLFLDCISIAGPIAIFTLYGLHAYGFGMHFGLKDFYVWGILIGGAFFGAGMAISGYFPGSEWMALGEGRRDAVYAIPAGLLGALAWTLLSDTEIGHWLVNAGNMGQILISGKTVEATSTSTILLVAIPFSLALLAIAWIVPRYPEIPIAPLTAQLKSIPGHSDDNPILRARRDDTAAYLLEGSIAQKNSFAVKIARNFTSEPNTFSITHIGIAVSIGLTVVLGLFLHQIFGESTTYSWIVSFMAPSIEYSKITQATVGWEPFSDLGTYLGGFCAATLLSKRYTAFRKIVPPSWQNRFGSSQLLRACGVFVGSFMVLFGARMAGGCASGHIMSGTFQMAASGVLFAAAVLISMRITASLVYGKTSEKLVKTVHPATSKTISSTTSESAMLVPLTIAGVILTIMIAAWATKGATGYAPEGSAWVISLIVPWFMALLAFSYYTDKPPYQG
jgi:uncharacterized membrane protein YedE/YeeE